MRALLLLFIVRAVFAGSPFSIDGYLDAGSAKVVGSSYNSGGTVSVQGNAIAIPDNMLVQFPGTIVSWADFVAGTLDGDGHEVLVSGNIVNGQAIAAQMQISGNLVQLSTGTISQINPDGTIQLANGPTIRINDPTGQYSPAFTDLPFFTSDPLNPSITSFGGFPMCIPGYKNCIAAGQPGSNRPKGHTSFDVADATRMVPFDVGDYLTYSGVEFDGKIVCYSIIANVGVYSETPGYILPEAVIIAPVDTTGNAALENGQSRFSGYITSVKAVVSISALDVDPCTGVITERLITTATPERTPVHGRYKFDVQKVGVSAKYTQSYRFKLSTGTVNTTDGILGGQYDSPVLTWTYPEVITPGAVPPETDFTRLGHLADGSGPDEDGNVFHQLKPWPGTKAPTPSKTCPDKVTPPTTPSSSAPTTGVSLKVAVSPQTVLAGIQLTVSPQLTSNVTVASSDLAWSWTDITTKPLSTITFTGANTQNISFFDPTPAQIRTLKVVVTHTPSKATATATAAITGSTASTLKDSVFIDSYTIVNSGAGTMTVVAHTNLVGDPTATMTIKVGNAAAVAMTSADPGQFSYTQKGVGKAAQTIVVTSLTKGNIVRGTATLSQLTARRLDRALMHRRRL